MSNQIIMTEAEYNELQEELDARKSQVRAEIANEISEASKQGDLSENSAYKTAMEKKDMNEARIQKIDDMLKIATIQKIKQNISTKVDMGSKVKIKNLANNLEQEFTLVGQQSANPAESKISIESPLGVALKGKAKGDTVKVNLPMGEVEYQILDIG